MKRILVIEDEADIRELIVDYLQLKGYRVCEAENGQIACNKILEEVPNLIICDVSMPHMGGFEFLKWMNKSLGRDNVPPLIFLTAKVEENDKKKGEKLGAVAYVDKPFEFKQLQRVIEQRIA